MAHEDDLFNLRAVWHVRHADGTAEDIVLEHGNYLEDAKGSAGQVLFERIEPEVTWMALTSKSTSGVVVMLQKLAKNVSYYAPDIRSQIITEAARRLTQYRNEERTRDGNG